MAGQVSLISKMKRTAAGALVLAPNHTITPGYRWPQAAHSLPASGSHHFSQLDLPPAAS